MLVTKCLLWLLGLSSSWEHMHVIVGISEMQNIVAAVMEN
jgi:hypothetical protein